MAKIDFGSFGLTNYGKRVGVSSRLKYVLERKSSDFRLKKS